MAGPVAARAVATATVVSFLARITASLTTQPEGWQAASGGSRLASLLGTFGPGQAAGGVRIITGREMLLLPDSSIVHCGVR